MPLNADDPVRVSRPFDRLDHAVRRVRSDSQAPPRFKNGLMMGGIDHHLGSSGQIQNAAQVPVARGGMRQAVRVRRGNSSSSVL